MRHELHQEHPERVDADGDRDGIDHRREEHRGRAAVQQFAHAEIGVDAGGQREDRGSEFEYAFEARDALRQQRGRSEAPGQGRGYGGSIGGHDQVPCGSKPTEQRPRCWLSTSLLEINSDEIMSADFAFGLASPSA